MPVLDTPLSAKEEEVESRLPSPGRMTNGRDRRSNGRGGSTEMLQHCLDLAVTGNKAASRTIHRFAETVDRVAPLDAVSPAGKLELIAGAVEMAQRLAHAPFDLGRTLVNTAVLVDVDVDVDIASKQCAPQESDQEGMR